MSSSLKQVEYATELPAGTHWSLRVRAGSLIRLSTVGTNLGMLLYNPENLLERYNAPDTLKCQHTFKLTRGHCLYSDMGRIFASVVEDSFGWHDTMMGNCTAEHVGNRWGTRSYQEDRNNWLQNGHDAFLVELAKYGLGRADMAANINWFSKVAVDESGTLALESNIGGSVYTLTLRFEIDTLVLMHTCPHPMSHEESYPSSPVSVEFGKAQPVTDDDYCMNLCPENQRGFQNNRLYNYMLA